MTSKPPLFSSGISLLRDHYLDMIEVLRETHEPPKELSERLARIGGRNLYGQPLFRVVWGWNRLTWMGGTWVDYDANDNPIREVVEYRREPKYYPFNRWHVERWFPPEHYGSPDEWKRRYTEYINGIPVELLGPYPSEGDYEHVFKVERPDGSFLPLIPHVCEVIVQAVILSRALPLVKRKAAILEAHQRRQREVVSRDDAQLRNLLEPIFYGQTHIYVPAKYSASTIPDGSTRRGGLTIKESPE